MTTYLPVNDAATALGVSVSSVRRGLKSGRLQGQRQATKQGFEWRVKVPAAVLDQPRFTAPDWVVAVLEPLYARLEAQAEHIGRLESELVSARAQARTVTSRNVLRPAGT